VEKRGVDVSLEESVEKGGFLSKTIQKHETTINTTRKDRGERLHYLGRMKEKKKKEKNIYLGKRRQKKKEGVTK